MMELVVAVGLTLLVVFVAAAVFAYVLVHCALACSRPLPGPGFPFERCSGSCDWCDHIDELEREEACRERLGPYRERASLPRTRTQVPFPEELRDGTYFPAFHVRIPDPPADLPEGSKQKVIELLECAVEHVENWERIGRQLRERQRQAREEVDEEMAASGIVLHGDRPEGSG